MRLRVIFGASICGRAGGIGTFSVSVASACALLADDADEERVLDITPERGAFRTLLDEVKNYLDG